MLVKTILVPVSLLVLAMAPRVARAGEDDKQRCGTAYEQTQVLRKEGKLTQARDRAVACSQAVCSTYVVRECTQFAREIEQSLATIVFVAKDDKGAEATAVSAGAPSAFFCSATSSSSSGR